MNAWAMLSLNLLACHNECLDNGQFKAMTAYHNECLDNGQFKTMNTWSMLSLSQ